MAAASTLRRRYGEPPLTSEATRQVLESVAGRGVSDLAPTADRP